MPRSRRPKPASPGKVGRNIIRDDYTGKIDRVNSHLLKMLLDIGYLPVVAPLAVSEKGEALNVDADRADEKLH